MSGGLSVGLQDFLRELASSPSPLSYFIKKGKASLIKKGKASVIKEGRASLIKEGKDVRKDFGTGSYARCPTNAIPMRRRREGFPHSPDKEVMFAPD